MIELSRRDKTILKAGGVFLAVFCLFQFIYFPAVDRRDRLKTTYAAQDGAIAEMKQLQADYQAMAHSLDQGNRSLANRPKNFSLFSFLDAQAQKSGVKQNVVYMKPFTQEMEKSKYKISKVKVKLKNVYLKGLIDFLSRIENSSNGVYVTSLSLAKTGRKRDKLEIVLEAQTLMLKEAS